MTATGPEPAAARGREPGVSVVLPVHNEQDNLYPLYRELRDELSKLGVPWEIVAVDDGSTDGSGAVLSSLARDDARVRVLSLDGNFGEAAALSAGFHAARHPIVVTMDADGQNDPADIPSLLEALARPGILAVSGVRVRRAESPLLRVLPSRIANFLIACATGLPARDTGCGLKAYRAEVVRGAALPPGAHRFLPAVLGVRPAAFCQVPVRDRPRRAGRSHYGLRRTFAVLRDLPWVAWVAHRGRRASIESAAAATAFSAGTALLTATGSATALPAGLLAATFAMAYWGARRFERARKRGVYRLRRAS